MDYRYLLSLGSNLGNRHAHLMSGVQLLACEVQIRGVTRIIETIPLTHPDHDVSEHGAYLNCVLDCASDRTPTELYEEVIKPIEDVIGHDREAKWMPRELDIDVLFWAQNDHADFHRCSPLAQHGDRGVVVPHVGVWARPFLMDLIENDLKVDKTRLMDAYH
jgi:2-amino-4-hydroxy-6-hydroxymethyldihydropteridine diphosphokinase